MTKKKPTCVWKHTLLSKKAKPSQSLCSSFLHKPWYLIKTLWHHASVTLQTEGHNKATKKKICHWHWPWILCFHDVNPHSYWPIKTTNLEKEDHDMLLTFIQHDHFMNKKYCFSLLSIHYSFASSSLQTRMRSYLSSESWKKWDTVHENIQDEGWKNALDPDLFSSLKISLGTCFQYW